MGIILRLKVMRKWQVFMWNIVFMVCCIEVLALTTFSMDVEEDAADRMGLSITLILTAVAFLHIVKSGLPPVPYLTFLDIYVYCSYLFLVAIMLETALLTAAAGVVIEDFVVVDEFFFWLCVGYLFLYHVLFLLYSMKVRREETMKLVMDSDQIEGDVNQNRPALQFDFRKGKRTGDNNRLLYFQAFPKKPREEKKEPEKDKEQKKQK